MFRYVLITDATVPHCHCIKLPSAWLQHLIPTYVPGVQEAEDDILTGLIPLIS